MDGDVARSAPGVAALRNHHPPRLRLQDHAQAGADDGVIVAQCNAQAGHAADPGRALPACQRVLSASVAWKPRIRAGRNRGPGRDDRPPDRRDGDVSVALPSII
jgi:hypothetical protein